MSQTASQETQTSKFYLKGEKIAGRAPKSPPN